MLPPPQTKEFFDRVLALEGECRGELEQSMQSLTEIQLLLSKTNSEVEKLANRELQMSNRVRDMEMHLDNYSREDIRDLYNTSHETQLRLFMMRSQSEQLQNRQQHIKDFQEKLRLLIDLLGIQATPTEDLSSSAMQARGTTGLLGVGTEMLANVNALSLVEAQEDERLRVAREISDGPTQTLTNLMMKAEICGRLIDRDVAEAKVELAGLRSMITGSLQESRRIAFDLRPVMLGEIGLVRTLRKYVAELQRLRGITCDVQGPDELPINEVMQIALFRFVQALLGALLSEGGADTITVSVGVEGGMARVLVEAVNVETERDTVADALQESHFQHRLSYFGATVESESRTNRGYAVEIDVPIPAEAITVPQLR